jgi:hypothetical protein
MGEEKSPVAMMRLEVQKEIDDLLPVLFTGLWIRVDCESQVMVSKDTGSVDLPEYIDGLLHLLAGFEQVAQQYELLNTATSQLIDRPGQVIVCLVNIG